MKNDVFTIIGLATFLICSFILIGGCITKTANAETHVIKDPIVFKHVFEGHDYLSFGGNYIIHSESCPCRREK